MPFEVSGSVAQERRVHLIGIGGVGMCALARLLSESGLVVSGSDTQESEVVSALRESNIHVSIGHDRELIEDVGTVIVSPAIPKRNPELLAARERGLRIRSRAEALAEFVNQRTPVCVTGSHGKTTTTAMLAFILERNGLDPGYMIGGFASSLNRRNAKVGNGPFVLEACEAFGALREWRPSHCIITNIDDEHAEHYGGVERLRGAFRDMVGRVSTSGVIAACGDDKSLLELCRQAGREVVSYGFGNDNIVQAKTKRLDDKGTRFEVYRSNNLIGHIELQAPGRHNICNALAATIIAGAFGLSFEQVAFALSEFRGVDRRCQLVGEACGVRILDDYAHHPAEIEATLAVAQHAVGAGGRLIVAFEPQLHSRVRRLSDSFAAALSTANETIVMPVNAAGESFHEPSDDRLVHALNTIGARFTSVTSAEQAATMALQSLKEGDVFVAIGPGQIARVSKLVFEGLQSRQDRSAALTLENLSVSIGETTPNAGDGVLLEQFLSNVRGAPNAPAVICGLEQVSYLELANQARILALHLKADGGGREQVVAVCLGRSIKRVVTFLGVMMADAVYLPIDPGLPGERAKLMLADADARIFVCDHNQHPVPPGIKSLRIDSLPQSLTTEEGQMPIPGTRAAAYMIYTSGTTGSPKGTIVEHRSLLNVARVSAHEFNITPASRVSQASSFGFDIAIGDMAMALYAGACLVVPNDQQAQPGPPLGRFIRDAAITHLSLTPSALSAVPLWDYPELTHIIVCGEKCPPDLAARWLSKARFFNAYGPAEATVWCTVDECLPERAVTIGRALENIEIYILDEHHTPVPRGTAGEIWIGGMGVARGYLNRPELTRERFSTLLFRDKPIRAYKTGDLGTMLEDGRIQFLGRVDTQIKLRGFRIELSEIEIALRRHPDVRDAVVDVRKDPAGMDRLIAYLIPVRDKVPPQEEMAAFLANWLPSYMIPQWIVELERVPFNDNQKLDRSALPNPWLRIRRGNTAPKAASTQTEKGLVAIFKRQLLFEGTLGIRDTFAELGIDSLQTAGLFLAIENQFGIQLSPDAMANADTIELLALYIDKSRPLELAVSAANAPLVDAIVRKQLRYVAAWAGTRRTPDSLICAHNEDGFRAPLFWCCQGNQEQVALASQLGPTQPLYAMRSGYLIFRYKQENMRALAIRYADEMAALQPTGPFRIGGNCQGGMIAREIALELRSRGRTVDLLCMLGPGRLPPYDGRIALIFGAESQLNPYRIFKDADRMLGAAYGSGYTISLISGNNDDSFVSPHVEALAAIVTGSLNELGR